jgi:hypothetical protein
MSWIRTRMVEAALHRERLIARADAQRAVVSEGFRQLRGPIAIADGAISAVQYLKAHPVLVATAVAALVAFRGRGAVSFAGRALSIWRVWRSISEWASNRPA